MHALATSSVCHPASDSIHNLTYDEFLRRTTSSVVLQLRPTINLNLTTLTAIKPKTPFDLPKKFVIRILATLMTRDTAAVSFFTAT